MKCMFEKKCPDKIPVLCEMLPEANGGSFPVSKAEQALKELEVFKEYARDVGMEYFDLISEETGMVVCRVPKDQVVDFHPSGYAFSIRDGCAAVSKDDSVVFQSKRFEKMGHDSGSAGEGAVEFVDLQSGKSFVLPRCVKFVDAERLLGEDDGIFRVKESSDAEWADWKAEILGRLLHASLETGNPIQWC